MLKRRLFRTSLLVGFLAILFTFSNSHADTGTFVPVSGTDATAASSSALTTTSNGDIFKLSLSDDKRMASNDAWPGTGAYDESKYIEFIFAPGVPGDAAVSGVSVTHEFRRATILAGAKLEVWDGSTWNDVALALPGATSSDLSETKDISSYISSSAAVNGLKVRFLAYRDTVATSATTSHDYLGLTVAYASAESTATPTPIPSETPTLTPSPAVTSTPTPIPSATPSPTAILTPSATASPTSTPTPVSIPAVTPVPTSTPLPTATPTSTPSASPTASPTPTFIPTPFLAEIASVFETPSLKPSASPTSASRKIEPKKAIVSPTPVPTPRPTPKISSPTHLDVSPVFESVLKYISLLASLFLIK